MMEYKGLCATIGFDDDERVFHGEVVDTRDGVTFEADSVEQLEEEFCFSIDDYLTACEERDRTPDRPFSGWIPLRLSPEVHRAATAAARAEGKSFNAWLAEAIEKAAAP